MYSAFRHVCERLLRIPHDPEPPPGDEASTRIFRAAPNFYRYLLFIWALRTGLILFLGVLGLLGFVIIPAVVAANHGHRGVLFLLLIPVIVLSVIAVEALFRLVVLRLEYEKRWYVVTDRSLRVREGVVTVREMTVNFANIQNISVSQGPLQRALGIADLKLDTAGGGGGASGHNQHQPMENLHTAWFRGINNAVEVRELIQQRLRLLRDSGLGDHEEMSRSATASPVASVVPAASAALLARLREVHAEARALRGAVESVKA